MARIDIHNYQLRFDRMLKQLAIRPMSERNRSLIRGYVAACRLHNTSGTVRLERVVGTLLVVTKLLPKDFDTCDGNDLRGLVSQLLQRVPAYSPETLGAYRVIIKRFFTWVANPAEWPHAPPAPSVAWMRCSVRARDQKRLERHELLEPHEVQRVLDSAPTARDRAHVSLLWETGARIGEAGSLELRHLREHPAGYLIDLTGKTGTRSVLVIESAPALRAWLAQHPARGDPCSPLWIQQTKPKPMQYQAHRKRLNDLFTRAGVRKRIYPHLFRHSRATYMLAHGIMNEQQAKTYFGWTPGSEMLQTYSHLTTQDANNALLQHYQCHAPAPRPEALQPATARGD